MYGADRSLRSDPPIHAAEGDDQIRTGGRWLSTPYTYVDRGREGFVYFAITAMFAAAILAPWVVLTVVILGGTGRWAWKAWA